MILRGRFFENKCKRHVVSKMIMKRSRRFSSCQQRLHWNVQDNWSKVIPSDERKVVIDQVKKIYVWMNV